VSGVRLTGGWSSLVDALDPSRVMPRLERNMATAGRRTGQEFQRRARAAIRGRQYAPNSPITALLKGSTAPLVADGDLFQSLTYKVVSPYNVRFGIMRDAVGTERITLGELLHDGATIDVNANPRIRMAVMAKLRAKGPRGVSLARGLGNSGGLWKIPGRPFITAIVESSSFDAVIEEHYAGAVRATFRERA